MSGLQTDSLSINWEHHFVDKDTDSSSLTLARVVIPAGAHLREAFQGNEQVGHIHL